MAEKRISADEGLRATELINRQTPGLGIKQLSTPLNVLTSQSPPTFECPGGETGRRTGLKIPGP